METARLVQYLVNDVLGPDRVGPFLEDLAAELEDGGGTATGGRDLAVRNYVVRQLCGLVGPAGLRRFGEAYIASAV